MKNIKIIAFTIPVIVCISCAKIFTNNGNNVHNTRSIYIASGDTIVNANIWIVTNPVKLQESKMYSWYYNNVINTSQGNYFGQLLHGDYTVLDAKTKTILSKGNFNKGVKEGKWMHWFSNGKLKETSEWKNGEQVGKYTLFDKEGDIVQEYSVKEREKQILLMRKKSKISANDSIRSSQPFWKRILSRNKQNKDSKQSQVKAYK